ncbi:MAG: DUF554 domain-containing protein [Candidatus Atribacteria bacterium]|jgi:uncharacterized membrane protein YqgA involved in biofilm formation|nr:DUF554 domain-containing protein [Candidatus Atribacteria bacterium]
MLGTIVNTIAIIIGCMVGLTLKGHFPKKISMILFQGIGLISLALGIQMAIQAKEILLIILAVVAGSIIGELMDIEARLEKTGEKIKLFFRHQEGKEKFTEGFVTTSLLFCVGSMAIMGAIEEGLTGNPNILIAKSVLDLVSSIVFAASLGIGVLLSAVPVFLYQGLITQAAFLLRDWITPDIINEMTAVGGILIIGLSLGILDIKKTKIANLLPSLLIIIVLMTIKKNIIAVSIIP